MKKPILSRIAPWTLLMDIAPLMRSLEAEESYPLLGYLLPSVCSACNEKGLLPPLMEAKCFKSKKSSSFL